MIHTSYPDNLTDRESEVLNLMVGGYSNKQIANKLNISIRTVKFHIANIYAKIEVNSRSAAIAWVWQTYGGKFSPKI